MGYHVSIIRSQAGQPIAITEDEIRSALQDSPLFRTAEDAQGEFIVEIVVGESPHPCLWITDGELWTKNPDDEIVDAMCVLARRLGGRVRGDELETYKSSSDFYLHPDDVVLRQEADLLTKETIRETRRKSALLNWYIAGFFIVMAMIAGQCSSKSLKNTAHHPPEPAVSDSRPPFLFQPFRDQ